MKQRRRDTLCVWRIRDDRRGAEAPCTILDCKALLGPPRMMEDAPIDNHWFADHPMTGLFRLADGRVHTLMTFRLTDALTTSCGGGLHPASGVWLATVSGGPARVEPWRF